MQKPPFKFLHDVISEVQRNRGFAPGLYDDHELSKDSITDKEAKVTYLRKMISVVEMVSGQPVPCDPLKVVAGLEPEATNTFLQMLGQATDRGNGAAEVAQVRGMMG